MPGERAQMAEEFEEREEQIEEFNRRQNLLRSSPATSQVFLATFRFDTAENEPAKNLKKFANLSNFAKPNPLSLRPLAAGEPALGG